MRIRYALLLSLVLHASAFVAMDIYPDWKMKNGLLALLQKNGGAKGSKYDGAPVKKPILLRIVQAEIFSHRRRRVLRRSRSRSSRNESARTGSTKVIELQEGIVMTLPLPGTRGADCLDDHVCFYQHDNYNNFEKEGYRLEFYECGQYDLIQLGLNDMISSWHNNQSGGAIAHVYNWDDRLQRFDYLFAAWNDDYQPYVGHLANDHTDMIENCPK